MSAVRPWAAGRAVPDPKWHLDIGGGDGTVLLNHGFLIESNNIWMQTGILRGLVATSHDVITIWEHFVRKVGAQQALGHDATLLLADVLASTMDAAGRASYQIVSAHDGVPPSLIAALNDARIERLVILHPPPQTLVAGSAVLSISPPAGPTAIELDLGLDCDHLHIDGSVPSEGLVLDVREVSIPVLIIANRAHQAGATELARLIPRAALALTDEDVSTSTSSQRTVDAITGFLST